LTQIKKYYNIKTIIKYFRRQTMEFDKIKEILAEQLGINDEDINLDSVLTDDLGADSLDLVELVMAMEQEFDIEISDEDAEKIKTVGDAVNYVKEKAL